MGGVINTIGRGASTLRGIPGVSQFAGLVPGGSTILNTAADLGGLFGDAASSAANFVGRQLQPNVTQVSNVPPELQAALASAGVNIQELLANGGALPTYGGAYGTEQAPEQQAASQQLMQLLGGGASEADLGQLNDLMSELRSLPPGDLGGTRDLISQITGLQGPNVGSAEQLISRVASMAQSPEQQAVISALLPSLQTAASAPRFDLTDTFSLGEDVFRGDLEDQLADIKAEYSALGLGPGSTDRARRLAETAARETSRFRLGQQDLARQGFESAEQRRLGAIGAGQSLADVLGRPAESLASIIPAALQAGSLPSEFQLRGLSSALPTLFQSETFAPQFQAANLQALLNSALGGARLDAETDLYGRQQQGDLLSQLFGFGTTNRQFGESEIDRRLGEFGRTQTGGYNLLSQLLEATPPPETGFGPSNISQLGQLGTGIYDIYSQNRQPSTTAALPTFGGEVSIGQPVPDINSSPGAPALPTFGGGVEVGGPGAAAQPRHRQARDATFTFPGY